MTEFLSSMVEYFNSHADGLDLIWKILAGICAAAIFLGRPIYRFIAKDKNHDDNGTVVVPFSKDFIEEIIRKKLDGNTEAKGESDRQTRTAPSATVSSINIEDSIKQISMLRETLKPVALSSEIFPSDLQVLSYDGEKGIKMRLASGVITRVVLGLWSLPFYLAFPIALTPHEYSIFGGTLGFSVWVWRNYLGNYISIDFRKKRYALVSPASGGYLPKLPTVEVRIVDSKDGWRTSLVIADQLIVQRLDKEKTEHPDLLAFASSLKWHFGQPVEIAEGVLICR